MSSVAISVIIPVYNTATYLADCLNSILVAQTFRNFIVICCNDCSTDESPAILAHYAQRYPTQLRIIHHTKNRGLAATLNTLMRTAETPYITVQDSDDLMHPTRLQRTYEFLEQNRHVDIVGSWLVLFRDRFPSAHSFVEQLHVDDHTIRSLLLYENSMRGGAVTIRTHSLHTACVWQNEALVGSEANDYDFFTRLAPHFHFANIPEPLYYYRFHQNQMSSAGARTQLQSAVRVSQQHLGRFGITVDKNILSIFHLEDSLHTLTHLLRTKRQDIERMLNALKGIDDFYGYSGVSDIAITTPRHKFRTTIRRHLLKLPALLYEDIMTQHPVLRQLMRGYFGVHHLQHIVQPLYRSLKTVVAK